MHNSCECYQAALKNTFVNTACCCLTQSLVPEAIWKKMNMIINLHVLFASCMFLGPSGIWTRTSGINVAEKKLCLKHRNKTHSQIQETDILWNPSLCTNFMNLLVILCIQRGTMRKPCSSATRLNTSPGRPFLSETIGNTAQMFAYVLGLGRPKDPKGLQTPSSCIQCQGHKACQTKRIKTQQTKVQNSCFALVASMCQTNTSGVFARNLPESHL